MSKYRNKKSAGKPKVFKQGEPKFDYTSACCSLPATKKPCSKGNGEPDDRGFFQSPLGTWNCSKCRLKCSVTRTVRKPAEEENVSTHAEADSTVGECDAA